MVRVEAFLPIFKCHFVGDKNKLYLCATVSKKSATATLRNPLTLLEQYDHHDETVGLIPIDSSPFLSFVCDLPYELSSKGYGKICFQVFKTGRQN